METLAQAAYESPVLTAVMALALAWGLTRYVFAGQGMTASSSGGAVSKDEALRNARARQQEALAAAAEARRQATGAPTAAPQPPAPTADPMPSRMKAALARADAADAAERRSPTSPAAPPPPPSGTQSKPSGGKTVKTAGDPNSLTQRLARLEKGKGPSDHNPLQGHGSGSSAGGSFVCKKKGG